MDSLLFLGFASLSYCPFTVVVSLGVVFLISFLLFPRQLLFSFPASVFGLLHAHLVRFLYID
jgi:hypothetical protein